MYIQSTIHPYHSIVKSKVHQNQPFLKPICYYIRIEGRERKRKGRKEEKNGHKLSFYFLRANPKSRLFQNVKEVTTNGIPKIRRCLNRNFLNSRNTDYFYYNPDFWNSIYIVYLNIFPICWIPKIGTYFKISDLCISRSTSYFWNGPISGIPIVRTNWSASRFLEFQIYGNCMSTNTLQ